MENNEKQYEIIFWEPSPEENGRRHIVKVPVSKEAFDDYYRDINAFRKKEQRHGRCACPKSKRLLCNMDCGHCPFAIAGDLSSLNDTFEDEDGNESCPLDYIPDTSAPIEDVIADEEEMTALLRRLVELLPDAIAIGELRLEGKTEEQIASTIGTPRKTTAYRIQKAYEILKKEFPEKL